MCGEEVERVIRCRRKRKGNSKEQGVNGKNCPSEELKQNDRKKGMRVLDES